MCRRSGPQGYWCTPWAARPTTTTSRQRCTTAFCTSHWPLATTTWTFPSAEDSTTTGEEIGGGGGGGVVRACVCVGGWVGVWVGV